MMYIFFLCAVLFATVDFFLKKIDEFWDTPTNLDEKMNELKRKLEVLNSLKEDTESRKSTEPLHPRKKLKKEVELWFRNVERMNGKILDLEQKIGESSVVSRGLFKGNIFKKIQEVEELFQQGKSHDCLVVDNPGWIGQALSTTTLCGGAAKFCMEEIWGYLMGADVHKIGVWGMGGIGKTTIMKLIHNQLLKETEKFNIVIWITVSKEMNIFKIQNRIATAMNVILDEDETIRAGMISEMLARKGKYVLILDDLWDKLSLEDVGIPEPSNGSKLLVTTQLLKVCRYLGCRQVKVTTLSKPDAWSLFLEKVGQDVLNHRDLLPLVESVAEECAGLPLAIVTTASSMKGVDDVHEWRNALHELQGHAKSMNEIEIESRFKNVERVNSKIQALEQKIGESNNVFSHGLFKGDVLKKIKEVEELQQGKSHDSLVADNPGWIGQALSTTTLFGGAAKFCMEEIWGYLMGADVQKIGVWGMGGIGKTTIMKLIHNQLLKETEKFDIVIWITVSKEMNIFKMQKRIAQAIGKTMKETLDKVEDETIRAGMIREMLDLKGKYVLILDDLWHKISLGEVGIPEPSNGSKLLVTTRLLNVCHYLDCLEVKVPTLSKQDAWSLFLEKVGQDVLNRQDLLPTVKSVAEECAGLPLAIVTVASSMKGVRDIQVWRNAFHELNRHVKSVNGMEEKVFQQLQISYDRLGDEKVKQCFLYCALYPEDWGIYNLELVNLWIAEGLVEEMDSMETEIDRGYAILEELINSCLVEDLYDKVKLHDVVRDMALRITSVKPRFLVKAGMQSHEIHNVQDWNEDLEKASLMNMKLQIPSQMPPLKCQNLTTLLLSHCSIESIPECFFEQMRGLKILDLSHNYYIKSLPNSISNLETLTTLLLGVCYRLEKVPSVSKLEALKKLDLRATEIKEIPDGMERLVNLKDLDLSITSIGKISDGILGKLTSLRYLALDRDTLVRGEEIGGLRKLESYAGGMFYDLKELDNYIRASEARIKTPSTYFIRVGACTGERPCEEECPSAKEEKSIIIHGGDIICTDDGIKVPSDVEELVIYNCTVKLCEEGAFLSRFIPTPPDSFSSLSSIDLYGCKNIKKLFSSNWLLHYLPNLKGLSVAGCEDIEEIIALESELGEEGTSVFKFTLPKLLKLALTDLPALKSICDANGVMVCDSIQQIEIRNCPKLKRIPLNLPLQDDGQPSPPPSLRGIRVSSKEWWESVEWDHPNDKSVLDPYVREEGQEDQNSDQDDQDDI